MEHDQEPPHEHTELEPDDPKAREPDGCGVVLLKVIAGIAVLFIVAVALVFGVCLMA